MVNAKKKYLQVLYYFLQTRKNYKMNIKHINIPYDQLSLFKQEQKYQTYLIQTLIYSTKVTLHNNNNKNKCIMIITKHHLWLQDQKNNKKVVKIEMSGIEQILKAEEHPEFVIFTDQVHDNLRISTTNQDRCHNIFSALSFYFNFIAFKKKTLKVYYIKQNSLIYFERTVKQKKTSSKFSLLRYLYCEVNYVQPNNSPDIYGKLVIHKFILLKQYNSQDSHLLHSAKINNQDETFICHTIDRDNELIHKIRKHQNVDFIEKLIYARCLQYKIQLLFEKLSAIEHYKLTLAEMFIQLYHLYDKMKQIDKDAFMTPQLICINKDKTLLLREFRYQELLFQKQYKRLIYQKKYKEDSKCDYFENKMYNIGMILYEFIFGRPLFEHEDLQVTIMLKENMKSIHFPSYINIDYTKKTKIFIQDCILGKLTSEESIKEHSWIRYNKVIF